jgi:FkbM family methyltransferase
LSNSEVYIDGGAYTGDTAEEFIKASGGGYAHVYSFEPDPDNYKIAARNLAKYEHVDLIQRGLWSKETELQFKTADNIVTGIGSAIVPSQAQDPKIISVPVTSLDAFFGGRPDCELPTLIKLDVEGAEKEALLGAAQIIRKTKPKLIICAYHKPEDIRIASNDHADSR